MKVHRIGRLLACLAATAALSALLAGCQTAGTQGARDPRQVKAHNMQLVGHHDLQARSAYIFERRACARLSRRTPDAMQRGGPGGVPVQRAEWCGSNHDSRFTAFLLASPPA